MADQDTHIVERKSYRRVYRRLWSNDQFRSLLDGERVVTLYIFTGPQTNRIGLFKFSVPMCAEDLGRPVNTIRRQFDRVREVFGWQWDASARVLWIPGWWKYNPAPKQDTNLNGALTDLNDVPRTALMSQFCSNLADIPEHQHHLIERWQSLSTAQAVIDPTKPYQTETRQRPDIDSAAPQSDASPTLLTFPTVGSGPKTWALTEARCAGWRDLYPGLDVLGECRKALAWIQAHQPKTAKGMPAFLVNWFNRAVAHGSSTRQAVSGRPGWQAKPVSGRSCPHVTKCASASQCAAALEIDPRGDRYPLKATVPV